MGQLKVHVTEIANSMKDDSDEEYEKARTALKQKVLVVLKGAPTAEKKEEATPTEGATPTPPEQKTAEKEAEPPVAPKPEEKVTHEEKK